MTFAIAHEDGIRLAVFVAVLGAMLAWELALPFRRAEVPRLLRWSNNLALVVIDGAVVRLVFPVLAVGAAVWAAERGIGLFNLAGPGGWVAGLLAFLALDLIIWVQHRVFHAVPLLWRLHRMHHADLEVDVTTGIRFHPGEILISMAIKIATVAALGAPPAAVLAFEIVLSATSLFSHANLRLPVNVERALGQVFVTPAMHRIHHSIRREETDSNFGFNLSLWDRLFRTYRAAPDGGPEGLTFGLPDFRTLRELWIDRMLSQPLRRGAAEAPSSTTPTTPRTRPPSP
ncbi:MAG: sterol desaturase family protein [Paracoccaceae bacterium]